MWRRCSRVLVSRKCTPSSLCMREYYEGPRFRMRMLSLPEISAFAEQKGIQASSPMATQKHVIAEFENDIRNGTISKEDAVAVMSKQDLVKALRANQLPITGSFSLLRSQLLKKIQDDPFLPIDNQQQSQADKTLLQIIPPPTKATETEQNKNHSSQEYVQKQSECSNRSKTLKTQQKPQTSMNVPNNIDGKVIEPKQSSWTITNLDNNHRANKSALKKISHFIESEKLWKATGLEKPCVAKSNHWYIIDEANIIPAESMRRIQKKCETFRYFGTSLHVVVLNDLAGFQNTREFAEKMFDKWCKVIRQRHTVSLDRGTLLFIMPSLYAIEIVVGKDSRVHPKAIEAIQKILLPAFRAGRFGDGIEKGIDYLYNYLYDIGDAGLFRGRDGSLSLAKKEAKISVVVGASVILLVLYDYWKTQQCVCECGEPLEKKAFPFPLSFGETLDVEKKRVAIFLVSCKVCGTEKKYKQYRSRIHQWRCIGSDN